MRLFITIFFILTIFACHEHPCSKVTSLKDSLLQIKSVKIEYPTIDTTRVTISNNYYQFVRHTDSTSFIKWGNKTISNISSPFFNYYLDEKVHLYWSNKKFISLLRSTGSDTWFTIILPLLTEQEPKFYENPMAFDKNNGIVVCEYHSWSDTSLLGYNILTGKTQAFGLDWKKCGAASFIHYCIDSISITNNILYVEWVLPNKIDSINKKEVKRLRLDL